MHTDETWGGPVILRLTAQHGVHLYDVPLALVWLAGVGCCLALAFERVGTPSSRPPTSRDPHHEDRH